MKELTSLGGRGGTDQKYVASDARYADLQDAFVLAQSVYVTVGERSVAAGERGDRLDEVSLCVRVVVSLG